MKLGSFVRLTHPLVMGLWLASIFSGGLPSAAQEIVPTGQTAAKVQLKGTVQDSSGAVIPGVRINVVGENFTKTAVTDAMGSYDLTVSPGQYQVTATAEGFGVQNREVTIGAGEAETINFRLGGPVPEGEPNIPSGEPKQGQPERLPGNNPQSPPESVTSNPPLPTPAPVGAPPLGGTTIVPGEFGSSGQLASWLNVQASHNLRLVSAMAIGKFGNIFVWVEHEGKDSYVAVPGNSIASAADLRTVLGGLPDATVVGMVWVKHDRFLVLRSNP